MSVRFWTAAKVMPSNHAREPASFRGSNHVDKLFISEDIHHHPVASLYRNILSLFGNLH